VDINSAVGSKAGLSDEKLLAVAKVEGVLNEGPFNAKEKLVIELADAMVTAPANISDDLYKRVRDQFSEEQLMELSAQIAFENFRARWNRVFDIPSDEIYKPRVSA
jgi:alkylhydroperoxidase family enzyme